MFIFLNIIGDDSGGEGIVNQPVPWYCCAWRWRSLNRRSTRNAHCAIRPAMPQHGVAERVETGNNHISSILFIALPKMKRTRAFGVCLKGRIFRRVNYRQRKIVKHLSRRRTMQILTVDWPQLRYFRHIQRTCWSRVFFFFILPERSHLSIVFFIEVISADKWPKLEFIAAWVLLARCSKCNSPVRFLTRSTWGSFQRSFFFNVPTFFGNGYALVTRLSLILCEARMHALWSFTCTNY